MSDLSYLKQLTEQLMHRDNLNGATLKGEAMQRNNTSCLRFPLGGTK